MVFPSVLLLLSREMFFPALGKCSHSENCSVVAHTLKRKLTSCFNSQVSETFLTGYDRFSSFVKSNQKGFFIAVSFFWEEDKTRY